ncbi:hypothetical protein ACI78T_20295 [Blastococcus sp. SYSU D00922]
MEREGRYNVQRSGSAAQREAHQSLVRRLRDTDIPAEELLDNLPLFASRHALGRVLLMHSLYERILDVHGVVLLFGVRWGRDLAILQALRSMLEPGNATRRIIGFDTFEGFASVSGIDQGAQAGDYGVTAGHAEVLAALLADRDADEGNHYPRREIVQGDASVTLPRWLEDHPETVVAMAYFDMDLYEPTRACLQTLGPYLTRGAVVGFDEVAHPGWPGETVALREVRGLDSVRLQRTRFAGTPSFFVVD